MSRRRKEQKPDPVPYRLAYWNGQVCATGDPDVLRSLLFYPGVTMHGALDVPGSFVALPPTRATILALEALSSPESVGDEYIQLRRELISYATGWVDSVTPTHLGHAARQLLHHQKEFVAMAYPCRGVFNASEQGLGKTTTGWVMAHLWLSQRPLIITLKDLIPEWVNDFNLIFPRGSWLCPMPLDREGIYARARTLQALGRERYNVPIINYEVVERMLPAIMAYRPDLVICDESWKVKNIRARTTEATIQVADVAEHVIELTGTPIGNNVGDLWAQLRILDPRFEVPGRTRIQCLNDWMQRYSLFETVRIESQGRTEQKPHGCSDPAGLMSRLEPYWYRATKQTCLNLPPKQYRVVELDLPDSTRHLYDQVVEQGEAALGADMSLNDARVVMIRLHQLASDIHPVATELVHEGHGDVEEQIWATELDQAWVPTPWGEEPDADFERPAGVVMDLTQVIPVSMAYTWEYLPVDPAPKIEWIKQFCHTHLLGDPSYRVIIWCRFTPQLDRITAEVGNIIGHDRVFKCDGRTKREPLNKAKQSFNSRHYDGVQVLVCQIDKMAFGHNLQACDHHIYASNSFSYVKRAQSEDRSHRQGREGAITYTDLVYRRTIDVQVRRALSEKRDLSLQLAPDTVGEQ